MVLKKINIDEDGEDSTTFTAVLTIFNLPEMVAQKQRVEVITN